jgi:hypothetical protein
MATRLEAEVSRQTARVRELEAVERRMAEIRRERDEQLAGTRALVDLALGTNEHVRGLWKQVIANVVADGHGENVQGDRDTFLSMVDVNIRVVEVARRLAVEAELLGGDPVAGADRLAGELVRIRAFRDSTAEKWRTVEDLEDLAAEENALTSAELAEFVKHHPPPAEWYEQDEPKPF